MRGHKAPARRNPVTHQLAQHLIAWDRELLVEHHPERLKISFAIGWISNGPDFRHIRQPLLIAVRKLAAASHYLIETRELHHTYRGLNVTHTVVEPRLWKLFQYRLEARITIRGIDIHAMIAQSMNAFCIALIRS